VPNPDDGRGTRGGDRARSAPEYQLERRSAPGPDEAAPAQGRGPTTRRRKGAPGSPISVDREALERNVGRDRVARMERKLREAARAYEHGDYEAALSLLRGPMQELAHNAEARELYGLTLYRLGRWSDAAAELIAAGSLGDSAEQLPAVADCYRALRRWDDLEAVWDELREASPSAAALAEGRIVVAGSLADRGRLAEAIELLGRGFEPPARPQEFHLRRMYALADLHERAGNLAAARQLFGRIAGVEPDFYDVTDRVRGLA